MFTRSKVLRRNNSNWWTVTTCALLVGVGIATTIACHDPASSPETSFHAEVAPLQGFSHDTGLLPAASPAQVQLKLSAASKLTVDAAFTTAPEGLNGTPGHGKVALDVHFKLDGRLKIDSPLKKYDGDLPGLKDIDIPVGSDVAFDPFLLDQAPSADLSAELPETELPPIPLGSVPGTLTLTIVKGSVLTSKFHGDCVSVASGQASYTGTARTSGTLVLKGVIALMLPAPLDKSIDVPNIEVPIPEIAASVTAEPLSVSGVNDSRAGAACQSIAGGADGGPDANADATADATVPDAAADAALAEYVEGTFDGRKTSLGSISLAKIDGNGTAAVYASSNASLEYPQIDLLFEPAVGTTTCAASMKANVIFAASSSEGYQATQGVPGTSCTIVVSKFGAVGEPIEGTFSATLNRSGSSSGPIQGSGSFHVIRRP